MPLNTPKQVQYWKRCLKTFLPHHYTGNDCNRMTLAFFILSALDLLGVLESSISQAERDDYVRWIYRCQHPHDGGFRGGPATDLDGSASPANQHWDPANLPATFFALSSLLLLRDDLSRLRRRDLLAWLPKLQRPDGSFGETLGEGGRVEGGLDMRFGYCAAGVRWMLRGDAEGPVDGVADVDVPALARRIQLSQAYDGGISEAPFHEAHAGFTYCALAALSFVGRRLDVADADLATRWLIARQTATLDDDAAVDSTAADETDSPSTCHDAHSFVKLHAFPSEKGRLSYENRPADRFDLRWLGFNGRCNKIADTCYAWWVGASLAMLGRLDLPAHDAARRYLLEKTQHVVGGFGKVPGDPPDILHSYLGLASLSLLGEPGLKPMRPAACISEDACVFLESLPWRKKFVGLAAVAENSYIAASGG